MEQEIKKNKWLRYRKMTKGDYGWGIMISAFLMILTKGGFLWSILFFICLIGYFIKPNESVQTKNKASKLLTTFVIIDGILIFFLTVLVINMNN